MEIVLYLSQKKYIILCEEKESLKAAISNINNIKLKKYEPHIETFVDHMEKIVDDLLKIS